VENIPVVAGVGAGAPAGSTITSHVNTCPDDVQLKVADVSPVHLFFV
jgi:hypothetical protein